MPWKQHIHGLHHYHIPLYGQVSAHVGYTYQTGYMQQNADHNPHQIGLRICTEFTSRRRQLGCKQQSVYILDARGYSTHIHHMYSASIAIVETLYKHGLVREIRSWASGVLDVVPHPF